MQRESDEIGFDVAISWSHLKQKTQKSKKLAEDRVKKGNVKYFSVLLIQIKLRNVHIYPIDQYREK